jgi:amino acid adenylation domain-containing protein
MFVYQQAEERFSLGSARLEPVSLDLGAAKFDLTLFVNDGETALQIAVEYRSDRYHLFWMQRLLDHFQTLLEQLPLDPERSATEVPMMAPEELRSLRDFAAGKRLESGESAPLPYRILDIADRSPQSPAVVCDGVRRSYGDLGRSARSIAHRLSIEGVASGDRVAVFLDRSVEMIEAIIGIHLAGAAYVPLDPSYPEARSRHVLEDAEVAAVLTRSALRHQLPGGQWSVVEVEEATTAELESAQLPELTPESVAYVLYTSGSTGRPKGVVVSHENLRASTDARLETYDLPPSRFLLLPSVAFDSSVAGIFWTLSTAGTLVIPSEEELQDIRRLTRLVTDERVTTLLCVPSLYAQLLRTAADNLDSLDTAIVAGESCPSRLVEEHFRVLGHAGLFNEYGPTEGTVWATLHRITEEDTTRPVSIGRPIPGVRVEVLDGRGRPVPVGIPGDAWIVGATVAQGYWRRPGLSEERFVVDDRDGPSARRYRTGDRVVWSEDGRLIFLGRDDDQIKLRGYRIEPGEIEAALLEFPGVEQAAVVARPIGTATASSSPVGAAQLVAFIEGALHPAIANWREDLTAELPEFMIPGRLVELPRLPRLPNGKIDRQQLREMVLEPDAADSRPGDVLDTTQQSLLSLWEGMLGRRGIALDDNFFELGGHSLLVLEMTLAIERDFELSLSAADVFENPTVRSLARRIEQRGGPTSRPYQHLFPIQPAGPMTPLVIAIPHFFTEMFAERFRGERPVYGLRGVGLRAEGNLGRWRSMSELGEELVDEVQRRFSGSAVIMAGYSFGATMAIEAVRLMEARGLAVNRLYLIAPMAENFYRFGPIRVQLDGLRQPPDELSPGEALQRYLKSNSPLTRRPYQRAWRWLAIEPWRRLLCQVGKLRRLAGLPLSSRILYADVRVDRFRLHAGYRPGPIHTPTMFFNAQETETDAAATWRPVFQGPFTVHQIPDPHLDDGSVDAAKKIILARIGELED